MGHRAAVIFATRVLARALRDRIDERLGYPKGGSNIGRGRHVTPPIGRTLRSSRIYQHPTLSLFAIRMRGQLRAVWQRLKAEAAARVAAGQAQPGDAQIAASTEVERDAGWNGETQGDN